MCSRGRIVTWLKKAQELGTLDTSTLPGLDLSPESMRAFGDQLAHKMTEGLRSVAGSKPVRNLMNDATRYVSDNAIRPAVQEGVRTLSLNASGLLGGGLLGRLASGSLGEAALPPEGEESDPSARRRRERYRDLINVVGSLGGGAAGLYAATKYGPQFFPKQSRAVDFGPIVAFDKGYRAQRKREDKPSTPSRVQTTRGGYHPGDVANVMQLAERIARRRKTGA